MSCAEYPQMPACHVRACAWNRPTLRSFRINTKKRIGPPHASYDICIKIVLGIREGLTQARHSPCNHPNQTLLLLLPCTIRPGQFSVNFETAQFNSDHLLGSCSVDSTLATIFHTLKSEKAPPYTPKGSKVLQQ